MTYEEFKLFADGGDLKDGEELSVDNKLCIAKGWALRLAYDEDGDRELPLSDAGENHIWGVVDVGYFAERVIDGRCSLQASLDFDMDKFERQLDHDIKHFKNLVDQHGL